MAKLPVVSGMDVIKVFVRAGWLLARQRGSHVSLKKAGVKVLLTVPLHREVDPGVLRRLIRDAGMTVEEFVAVLGRL